MHFIFTGLVIATLAAPAYPQSMPASCSAHTETQDSTFKAGDVWTYRTRLQDAGSTITVLKVEATEKIGTVVHVRVDGIHLVRSDGFVMSAIEHMPFSREAILASVLFKKHSGPVPDYSSGYENWSSHCGGVYTIPVSQAVQVDQDTLSKGSQRK